MRKINISNDSRRDAEVAFGSTIHRQQPVYKTSNGKRSVNERRVRCTLALSIASNPFTKLLMVSEV